MAIPLRMLVLGFALAVTSNAYAGKPSVGGSNYHKSWSAHRGESQ